MPSSNGSFSGAIPGLTLRAWVVIDGFNGGVVSGFNVTSAVRNSVGNYTVTLTNALPNQQPVIERRMSPSAAGNSAELISVGVASVASIAVNTFIGGALADPRSIYLGIYA